MGQRLLEIAVVGADSLVITDLVESLLEGGFPMGEPSLFSEDPEAVGQVGDEWEIRPLGPGALASMDLVFLLPGASPEPRLLEEAIRGGATIIDGSGRSWQEPAPLIFPGINDEDLDEAEGAKVVALPSPIAAQIAAALLPFEARAKIASLQVVSLEAVATAGVGGLNELSMQSVELLSGKDPTKEVFNQRIAFNLIPRIGALDPKGGGAEEGRVIGELERLLGRAIPTATVSSVWVPIFHGTTQILSFEVEGPLDEVEAQGLMQDVDGLKPVDEGAHGVAPMPMLVVGDDDVLVGRVRQRGASFHLLSAADSLRFGVVAPMLRLAKLLLELGRLPQGG